MLFSFQSNLHTSVHSLFQLAWGSTFLLMILFPVDVLAGNMLEKAIELVNKERSGAGISSLTESALLTRAAEAKAEDMLKNDYFAHTSPSGKTPWHWLKQAGYSYRAAGENLAINYDDAKEQHGAWMKSETHRANIMNSHFKEIGMATRQGKINGKEATVTVQLFGASKTAVSTKAPAETKELPMKAIQGVETREIPTMSTEVLPLSSIPSLKTNQVTVLVNKTLFETIRHSRFITENIWLMWAELLLVLLFFSVALALPSVFIGEMIWKLYASLKLREVHPFATPHGHTVLLTPGPVHLLLAPPKRRIV